MEQADREHRFNFHGDYMGLLRPLVPFERIMFDRTMFHVRVARDIISQWRHYGCEIDSRSEEIFVGKERGVCE